MHVIDIHSHILAGIDDGAKTLDDSLLMAEKAVEEGITKIIATPHHQHPNFQNEGPSVIEAVANLNKELIKQDIPLEVLAGQEVRLYGEMRQDLKLGAALSLANSKYVLIELPTNQIPAYTTRLLYEVSSEGYIPVIAHPERNKVFLESPDKLYELIKNGALGQLTTSSLTGYFGKEIGTFSRQLIEANLVHVLASDAHNLANRTFRIQEAFTLLEDEYGQSYTYAFQENAQLLASDKHLFLEPPERVVKKRKKRFGLF